MKIATVVLGLVMSSASFSATILNGVKLSGLPTATKSYSKNLSSVNEINNATVDMESSCKFDRAATEALLVKNGSKILASEGCFVTVVDNSFCDQGGCGNGIEVETNFVITFK